jgi:hypothetical protein
LLENRYESLHSTLTFCPLLKWLTILPDSLGNDVISRFLAKEMAIDAYSRKPQPDSLDIIGYNFRTIIARYQRATQTVVTPVHDIKYS